MNLSGAAVKGCMDFYRLESRNLLIVHDDLDLSLGRVKVAEGGGAGGHKGVQSIIEHLHTREFSRIKIGIGRPRYGEPVEDYVLSAFYKDERNTAQEVVHLAVRACELFVGEGIDVAMNRINCQNLGDKEERS
jgi:PTH1 family peptidyl-tRNA hydrolase